MPTFSSEAFQSFVSGFRECFSFLMNTLHGLIDVIRAYPIFFMPLFLLMLLGVAFWVGWLIMEVAPNAGGTEFQNPYKVFSNPSRVFSNPNRQFGTKMPFWSSLGRGLMWKHEQEKQRRKIENQRAQEAYEKIAEEQEALESKHKLHAVNQAKADEYFRNNPNRTKVTIDGMEFFNGEDWYKKKYGKQHSSKSLGRSYDLNSAVAAALADSEENI